MSDKNYLSVYAKSFNWAGFFLPKKTYEKCSVLFDFFRFDDNTPGTPAPGCVPAPTKYRPS